MRPLIPLTTVAVLALNLTGCTAATNTVEAVGTVTDPVRTVAIPALTTPTVNLDAGFSQTSTTARTANPTASTYQLGTTQLVAKVTVSEGTPVRAGQVLVTLDPTALLLQVEAAKADQAVAKAQVGVLTTAINDTYTMAHTVATNTTKVNNAINTLTQTLADLKKAKPQLRQARADLATKLAQAETLLAHYPPVAPPGVPGKDELKASIAKLKAAITAVDAQLAQIAKAEPQLSTGLTKARAGLVKLKTAAAKISDARQQLRDLRKLSEIAANTSGIGVELATVQRRLAILTAPVDGVVTWLAGAGARLAPGATVVKIRQTGPSKVTAWLSPNQLAKVCLNDSARLAGDWMSAGQTVAAQLTRISPTADFPPSSTATGETHLTRAVQVEFTATAELPAGVPVVISISGCHPAAGQSEQDR